MKLIVSKIFRYLLQGVIILSPIFITVYIAYALFDFFDTLIPGVPRGLGFLIVLLTLILIGWLGSRFLIWRILIDTFDRLLEKTPFLKIIYTSVKDFAEGFMGEKRKFTKPVLIRMSTNPEIHRVGFVTQKDLSTIGLHGKRMVYIPHSYNFSGNLFIVDAENVSPLDMKAGDAMKLAVSGGVAGFNEEMDGGPANEKVNDKAAV